LANSGSGCQETTSPDKDLGCRFCRNIVSITTIIAADRPHDLEIYLELILIYLVHKSFSAPYHGFQRLHDSLFIDNYL